MNQYNNPMWVRVNSPDTSIQNTVLSPSTVTLISIMARLWPLLSVNKLFQYTLTLNRSLYAEYSSHYIFKVFICFHFSFICCVLLRRSPPLLFFCASLQLRLNKHTDISQTQKKTGENRAPRKCNISVFNIEVYKIRAEMGSIAICLFIYFLRRERKKNLPISVCIWGARAPASELILYEK